MARGRGISSQQPTDGTARGRARGRGRAQRVPHPPVQMMTRAASHDQSIRPPGLGDEASLMSPYVHGSPYHVRGASPAGPSSSAQRHFTGGSGSSSSAHQHSTPSPSAALPSHSPEMTGQFHTPSPSIPVPPRPQDPMPMHEDADEDIDDPQQQPQQGDKRPFFIFTEDLKE